MIALTMQEAIDKKVKENIETFHFYIWELGIEKAKEISLKSSCLVKVQEYINAY